MIHNFLKPEDTGSDCKISFFEALELQDISAPIPSPNDVYQEIVATDPNIPSNYIHSQEIHNIYHSSHQEEQQQLNGARTTFINVRKKAWITNHNDGIKCIHDCIKELKKSFKTKEITPIGDELFVNQWGKMDIKIDNFNSIKKSSYLVNSQIIFYDQLNNSNSYQYIYSIDPPNYQLLVFQYDNTVKLNNITTQTYTFLPIISSQKEGILLKELKLSNFVPVPTLEVTQLYLPSNLSPIPSSSSSPSPSSKSLQSSSPSPPPIPNSNPLELFRKYINKK